MWGTIANGLDLLALVAMTGALVQAAWLLPAAPGAAGADAVLARRADRYATAALAWLTFTTLFALVARSADISGAPPADLPSVLPLVLAQTYFGHVWLLRAAVMVAWWIAWATGGAARRGRGFACCALVGLLLETWAWCANAHPGDHGGFTLDVWVAMLHVLSAGLWGGTVLATALVVAPVTDVPGALDAAGVPRFVRRLSAVSALGLALVVASGTYNAWVQLAHVSDFWTTRYGRVLDVKLALVAAMALVGAGNRYLRVPRVLRAYADGVIRAGAVPALRSLLRAVAWEAAILVEILVAVAVLVDSMPPDMPGMVGDAMSG